MAEEIIERTDCSTIYRDGSLGPAVPYPAVERGAEGRNHGFIDLRRDISLVERVPEVQDSPGIREFLRAVNAPTSPLMSLGCEHGLFRIDGAKAGEPQCYQGSYIDLAFVDPRIGSVEANLVALARAIVAAMNLQPGYWIFVEFVPQKMRHFYGDPHCFNVMMRLCAHGRDPEHALEVLDRAYRNLSRVIERVGHQIVGAT